jgi:uncharacterized membrane protein YfcA
VFLCFIAGVLSSLVGIGGSTIKGPILLHMGLDASLAKATAQLMVSALLACLSYVDLFMRRGYVCSVRSANRHACMHVFYLFLFTVCVIR